MRKSLSLKACALAALLTLSACGAAASGAMIQANNALQDKDYDRALGKVDDAQRMGDTSDPEFEKRVLSLKARIYEAKGDQVAASGIYQYILDHYPNSEEAYLARSKLGK
jgi:hypothetical protein